MNGRTGYGELLRDTTHALAVAQVRLVTTTFSSKSEARRAIAAYRDVAAALATLTGRLVCTGQRFNILPGHAADDRLRPGARLCDVLESLGKALPWTEDKAAEPLVAAWATAAQRARAAQDLLGTHWDHIGIQLSPTASALEAIDLRVAAVDQITGLAATLADSAEVLALKAMHVGLEADANRLRLAAAALRKAIDDCHRRIPASELDVDGFALIEVASPLIRTGDPRLELGDRVARLHRYAWQLTRHDRVGIGTLVLYAAGGCLVNRALGRLLNRLDGSREAPSAWAAQQRDRAGQQAGAWHGIYRQLLTFRSSTPAVAGVRADIGRVRNLIRDLADDPQIDAKNLGSLLGASRAFDEIAGWNRAVLKRQGAAGNLWLLGKQLPRDLTSSNHDLAAAKILGHLVPTPPGVTSETLCCYAALRASPTPLGRLENNGPLSAAID